MDYSQFSDEDLLALKSKDYSKMSDEALLSLKSVKTASVQAPAPTPEKASLLQNLGDEISQNRKNLAAGALRGAGSIGATILAPADMINQKLRGEDFWSLKDNRKRRAKIDSGLEQLGADTDSTLYKTGKFAGEIAGTAGTGGVMAKGAQLAGATPKMAQALKTWGISTGAKSTTGIGKVSDALLRTGAGATTATASGAAINPEPSHITQNAAIGGGIGLAIPAFGAISNKIRDIKDIFKPSAGKIARDAAGDKVDDVIRALETTKSNVPGVNLTAGQASASAGSAEFAALEKTLSKGFDPSLFFGKKGVLGQQEAARLSSVVKGIGKTQKALEAAKKLRKETSSYDKAFERIVGVDSELKALSKNPYFAEEAKATLKLSKSKGLTAKDNLTEILHDIKTGLDAKLAGASNPVQPAINKSVTREIRKVKKNLVAWLGKNNTDYDVARLNYIDKSKPINQMRIGQDLERALTAPGTGKERATSFSNVVRKAETKISKGSDKPVIDDLTPSQKKVVDAINEDFARNAEFKTLASAGAKNLGNRVRAPFIPPPGFFNPTVTVARGFTQRKLDAMHKASTQELTPYLTRPKDLANLMKNASPKQRKVLDAIMEQWIARTSAVKSSNIQQQGER